MTDMPEYMRQRRLERRKTLISLKGGVCQSCGSGTDLEFDHRDRSQKLFTLSGCALDKSWDKILDELHKCDLLCKTCHKVKTKKSGDLSNEPWNKLKCSPYVHGSARMYSECGCRCESCKSAKILYRAKKISYKDVI